VSATRESFPLRTWLGSLDSIQRALCGLAVVIAAACVVLLLSWRRTPEATATVPLPPEPPGLAEDPQPETPFAYDAIVEKNPFEPARQPPARPWGLTLAAATTAESSADVVEAESPPPVAYRLYGTVVRDGRRGSFALIEADPEIPGPERYEIGDRVGQHRLRRIEATSALLSGGVRLDLDQDLMIGTGGPE
jgi:hypothetical protein